MKFRLADGAELQLKPLTDQEYDQARRLAPKSLDACPTCGGRASTIPGSGQKHWVSFGYQLNGENHDCDCQAQIALYARYVLANIGTQYQRLDWDNFAGSSEADQRVRGYVAKWRNYLKHGFGLTFASKKLGVGKTFAATHIAKELIKQRQQVFFLDFVDMVNALCTDDTVTMRRMKESTFLVLDDVRIGISERQHDLYALKFEVVIRHRTSFDLPTIFTTNLAKDEFEQGFERIYSLIAPKQTWVEMSGVDHRKLSDTAVATLEMIERGEIHPIT